MAENATSSVAAVRQAPAHLRHVEGLRAIAALVVYVNHAYGQTWNCMSGQFPSSWFMSLFTYSLVAGHMAVAVFIVISGFCLTLPVVKNEGQLRGGTRAFLARRARRILPPYYAAVGVCMLLIWTIIGKPTGTLWDEPVRADLHSIVAHLFLVQDFFATAHINYVFWSIAVEWQIYWLFPIFVWSWRRYGPAATVAAALVVGYVLRFQFAESRLARGSPHFIGFFALGMLAAYVARDTGPTYRWLRDRVPWGLLAGLFGAAVAIACAVWGWDSASKRLPYLDFPVALAATALLIHTSSSTERRATGVLAWRPLVLIGTFSYSVYLIHAPMLQIMWQYVLSPAHVHPVPMFWALMGPGAVVTLAVAYAFFRLFEEPFMRAGRRKASTRTDSDTDTDQVRARLAT